MTTALTIGNFDGVHRGHVALLTAAREAVGRDGVVVALTFDPHPLVVLRPDHAPPRLSTAEQRRAWLRAGGADRVERLEPTRELLGLEPEAFVDWLVERFSPAVIVEGPDFRFGRARRGDVDLLAELGRRVGFEVRVVEEVVRPIVGQMLAPCRSSLIRWLLRHGRVGDAAELLGRPYELVGEVVPGARRGRTIGVPTANLHVGDRLLPADGVYAARATDPGGRSWPAALSVGTNPTFPGDHRRGEVHLIGWDGDADHYGWTTRIEITAWLREQIRYDRVEPLIEQIHRDLDAARAASARGHVPVDLDEPAVAGARR